MFMYNKSGSVSSFIKEHKADTHPVSHTTPSLTHNQSNTQPVSPPDVPLSLPSHPPLPSRPGDPERRGGGGRERDLPGGRRRRPGQRHGAVGRCQVSDVRPLPSESIGPCDLTKRFVRRRKSNLVVEARQVAMRIFEDYTVSWQWILL